MAQVQNTPLTADPSILRDIESEVTQETRPLLQFIVNNAKLIVGVVVGLLVAIPGVILHTRLNATTRALMSDMEGFTDDLIGRIAFEFQRRAV